LSRWVGCGSFNENFATIQNPILIRRKNWSLTINRLTPTPDSGERKARYRKFRMSHFIPTQSSQTQPEVETTTATATAILDNWDTPQTLKARGSAKISAN
jgi:hypothetical protein